MSKKRLYRAGIIGLGGIGFRYTLDPLRTWVSSHLQAYKEHPLFSPVALCDKNIDRLNDARRYYPEAAVYTSWEKMLRTEQLDILSVCVSPEMNYHVSRNRDLSKLKAVFLEKPLAFDAQTGRRIANNLKRKNIVSAVNYFRRYQGVFFKIKDLLKMNAVGNVRKIIGRYSTGLFNGGVHMIDILQYLFGNFTEIRGLERNQISGRDAYAYSAFGRIEEVDVFLTGFDKSLYNLFEIDIWGDRGELFVDNYGGRIGFREALPSKRFTKQLEIGEVREYRVHDFGCNFKNALDNIISVVKGDRTSRILSSANHALDTTRVAEAIVNSYRTGAKLVKLK